MSVVDLIRAIEANNLDRVMELTAGGNHGIINKRAAGEYPLNKAAALVPENMAIMDHLLSFPTTNPNVGAEMYDAGTYTPIGHAMQAGNNNIVQRLVQDDRTRINEQPGCYPLHLAVEHMNHDMVVMLIHLERTNDINAELNNQNPLTYALESWSSIKVDLSRHIDALVPIFEFFLFTAHFNVRYDTILPIVFLIPSMPLELAEIFFSERVACDIRLNYVNPDNGQNILHYGIDSQYPSTIDMILDSERIDANQVNRDGNTPFMKYCLQLLSNVEHNIRTFRAYLYHNDVAVDDRSGDGRRPMEILLQVIKKIIANSFFSIDITNKIKAAAMVLALDDVEKTREDIQYICENRKNHFVKIMLTQAAKINEDFIRDILKECRRAEKAPTKNKRGGSRGTRRRKTQRKNRNAI